MNKIKIAKGMFYNLLSFISGMILVVGELDDSPGLGGIGLIVFGASLYLNAKNE